MLHSSRNKIRHRILPDIENQFGRDVRKTIWRAAQIWSEEEAVLDSLVSLQMIPGTHLGRRGIEGKMPVALQRRAILRWLRALEGRRGQFRYRGEVRSLIEPGTKGSKK